MIINERLTAYLHSLEQDGSPFFEDLRKTAEENDVPIIRRETERFLRTFLAVQKPKTVLEIGTGIGYSTLVFAEYGQTVSSITTIENYLPRIEIAKNNFDTYFREGRRSREEVKIDLLEQDAVETVKNLEGAYDLIFLDGPKAQYIVMLPELIRLLAPGGVLVADNVLQEGDLLESRYTTQRRQRTIHERMREFVWETMHHPQLESSLLTVGDGVIVSVKKETDHDK